MAKTSYNMRVKELSAILYVTINEKVTVLRRCQWKLQ